jgi:hypothetical protein
MIIPVAVFDRTELLLDQLSKLLFFNRRLHTKSIQLFFTRRLESIP